MKAAFQRWTVAQAKPQDKTSVTSLCVPVEALPEVNGGADVTMAITVDGSDSEVEATREYPTIKVGYIRVAGSLLDINKLKSSRSNGTINPIELRRSYESYAFDAALPGSGLVLPGNSGRGTWRVEIDRFLRESTIDNRSIDNPEIPDLTLADALLIMHGRPASPAKDAPVRVCPSCATKFIAGTEPRVTRDGGSCPKCKADLYLGDVLRTHDEYVEEGSNQTSMTRAMVMAERLMTLGYMDSFVSEYDDAEEILRRTIFITDGPLALFGAVAPLKRRLTEYNAALYEWGVQKGLTLPLLVGIEKSGRFVEHADLIKDLIPVNHVMHLTTKYINKITGRPENHAYGVDEFYGRRFIYRTSSGDPLVITVPPKSGILPYRGDGSEDLSSYPTLRVICEVLDKVRTRLYPNALIPVALAHNAASLPLGVGHSVLRAMAQKGIGLPKNSQIRYRSPF
ncbi:hypothetical protein [Actinoplanes cyaneus]|uniref:hypothetical protein n=1 Tax=Actinoplanes cyaneus TaxID=52696 RepID=UPI0019451151|nr:hypothetical protein [Actinoplanes cyaneus]